MHADLGPAARLVLLALAALAGASWWLHRNLGTPATEPEERPAPDGFYMTEAEITTAGPDGLPRYRLIAEEIRQTAMGGETLLRDVRIDYNLYSPAPWLLTAPEGTLSADRSQLELWGGVVLVGESGDHGRTSLDTERLEIDTAAHVARTAEPVDLSLGSHTVSGVGMVAYLLEERLQLQSEVHGRFLP